MTATPGSLQTPVDTATPSSLKPWSHNHHYHPLVLAAMPPGCRRSLDVGCGSGELARQIAQRSAETIGLDADSAILPRTATPGLTYVAGEFLTYPALTDSLDFIAMMATLHHLPLLPALERCRTLLRPGGVLAIVGLYRPAGLLDHAWSAAGMAASWWMRRHRTVVPQQARVCPPQQTLSAIRAAAITCLPGAPLCRRRLLFRFSLVWRKP